MDLKFETSATRAIDLHGSELLKDNKLSLFLPTKPMTVFLSSRAYCSESALPIPADAPVMNIFFGTIYLSFVGYFQL